MSDFTRSIIDGLLPKGAAWTPKEDGDFDRLLNGIADCYDDIYDLLNSLAYIREPAKTPILEDLEREFGVHLPTVEESLRRQRLGARKYVRRRDGTKEQMEYFLEEAGFVGIEAHNNDPAVDPSSIGSFLLVNNLKQNDNTIYDIPTDPVYWPNFVFVGGEATRDIDGRITSVARVEVDIRRMNELKNILVGLKGMHIWIILMIEWVFPASDTGDEPFGFKGDPDARGYSDIDHPTVGGRYQGV